MRKSAGFTLSDNRTPSPQSISLADAYNICDQIIRQHSKSFYVATLLLPKAKRQAIRVLYAFCRESDDLVDEATSDPRAPFERWVKHANMDQSTTGNPILVAWQDLYMRYALSAEIVSDLLQGIHMDLSINRYATFSELELYCYRVAGTVGLLSMQIIGHKPHADEYAIKLGVALQLTNILRDVGEDAQRGRIYIPLDELKEYHLTADELLTACQNPHSRTTLCQDPRWQGLMQFQIQRARRFYQEAWPGIALLERDGRYAVAAAATLYQAILAKIEANHYDNFSKRAFVPNYEKIWMLPKIWWRAHRLHS